MWKKIDILVQNTKEKWPYFKKIARFARKMVIFWLNTYKSLKFFARSARKKYEKGVFGAAHQRKTNLGRLPLETFFGLETPMMTMTMTVSV